MDCHGCHGDSKEPITCDLVVKLPITSDLGRAVFVGRTLARHNIFVRYLKNLLCCLYVLSLQTHKVTSTPWHAILFTNFSINELCAYLVCLVRKASTV